MKRIASVLASLLIAGLVCDGIARGPVRASDDKKIEMVTIKNKELMAHITALKGKVVIVDLWGFFCKPCKEEFPGLIRMHHTYGSKGVVCISVSLDFNEELKTKAVGFLREKKAVCTNFWLEDGLEESLKMWPFEGAIPVVIVYGKDGKIAKLFQNDDPKKDAFTYKDVEEVVKKKLKE